MSTDSRIDRYIEKSAAFAQPVLTHLRELIHKACPEVEETIKWGFPHFQYHDAIVCSMAAFKEHCAFGFWKASMLKDPNGILKVTDRHSMGHLDRITSLKDLPSDKILIGYIKEAAKLNQEGIKLPPKVKSAAKPLATPAYLTAALGKNKKAKGAFDAFSPSHRNDYIEWLTEAKTEATRLKRLDQALEWIAEGKRRNWKYERK